MQKDLLSGYLRGHLMSVQRHIQAYVQVKKPSHLHQLRVDIKEIRALFSFANAMYKEKFKANELKPLFHQAGKIREIRIVIHLIKTMPGLPGGIIGQLKKKEKKLGQQFIKNSNRYIRQTKSLRKKTALPESLPDSKKIEKYFIKETREAMKKLPGNNRDCLHRYRMKIKKLIFVYSILPRKIQKEVQFKKAVVVKQQKQLGAWHDTYAAIVFLSQQHFHKRVAVCIAKLRTKEKRQWNDLHKGTALYSR